MVTNNMTFCINLLQYFFIAGNAVADAEKSGLDLMIL